MPLRRTSFASQVSPDIIRMRKVELDPKKRQNNLKHAKKRSGAGIVIPPAPNANDPHVAVA